MIFNVDMTGAFGPICHDDLLRSLCARVGPVTAAAILQKRLRAQVYSLVDELGR